MMQPYEIKQQKAKECKSQRALIPTEEVCGRGNAFSVCNMVLLKLGSVYRDSSECFFIIKL